MSRVTFENYGKAARLNLDSTIASGRYALQRLSERRIVMDVAAKLALSPNDHLLEIGCGPGNLLVPLSFLVEQAVGIDHPDVCARLRQRFSDERLELVGANFLEYEGRDSKYSKVLIYSVLNTLADQEEAIAFVDKAASLLASGGRLLIGDIANSDRKVRFTGSNTGRDFQRRWEKAMASHEHDSGSVGYAVPDDKLFFPNDIFVVEVLTRLRGKGLHAYVLPQPPDLPFGRTREDILAIAPL